MILNFINREERNKNMPEKKIETKQCTKCKEDISADATKCKHCGADLRNWFVKHKIISGILILIVIVIIGSAMSGGGSDEQPTGNSISSPQIAEEETPSESKEWQEVLTFSANAHKQSETFHLEGGQQKVIYKTTGGSMSICSVYVMDEGTSLDESGGFPVVIIDGSKSDETMMRKKAGDYYLDVSVANGTCTIELQEYR